MLRRLINCRIIIIIIIICIAPHSKNSPLKRSGVDHTALTLQTHHTCIYLVSVHQTAPPIVIAAI